MFLWALLLFVATTHATGDLPQELTRLTAYFEKWRDARYMEKNCVATTFTDWSKNLPLRLCNYTVNDEAMKTTRWAQVVLLDAEPAQLARWTAYAVLLVKGEVNSTAGDVLSKQIIEASGAQFPVAGVVYEDMDGTGMRVYPFRNGVTVDIQGLPTGTVYQPTATQMHQYLYGPVANVHMYARIQSTTREQYVANGGDPAVLSNFLLWPDIIRRSYSAAWGFNDYDLMLAWARANL
jgi:hypothetical protein